jgi:hypothetical protein
MIRLHNRINSLLAWLVLPIAFASCTAHAALDLLYINRCSGGCALIAAGTDDAINRRSTLLSGNRTVPEFPHGDAAFSATVACVRSTLAAYDVDVVTTDPGAVARREVIVAGSGQSVVGISGLLGDSPFDGTPKDNTIAFAFAVDIGADVDKLCLLTAQQFGSLYGLDFELNCPDIMSFSQACGIKMFTNFDASCGETTSRTCNIPGSPATQNTAMRLALVPGQDEVIFRGLFEVAGPSP